MRAVCHSIEPRSQKPAETAQNGTPAHLSIYSYKNEKCGWMGQGKKQEKTLPKNHKYVRKEEEEWWSICSSRCKTLDMSCSGILAGNREREISGRGTSGINSLDTHRSFVLRLLLPLFLPKPKSCVLSLRKMCCVTTQKTFHVSFGTIQVPVFVCSGKFVK